MNDNSEVMKWISYFFLVVVGGCFIAKKLGLF